MNRIFINGMGAISPQQTFLAESLQDSAVPYEGSRRICTEPDYAPWIDVKAIRRMSRIIRMGVATAGLALKQAGLTRPDGIITGTGYGCLDDTGIFLSKMLANNEESLNPTPFIQSTHNSIGSQIGLLLQCLGYNQTYVQGSFSLECALQDALMQLEAEGNKNLLVGGMDEITELSHAVLSRFGLYRRGASHGEGSAFFLLSGQQQESTYAEIKGVGMVYNPETTDEVVVKLKTFLDTHSMTAMDVDLVLLGTSGDDHFDRFGNEVAKVLWNNKVGRFKHLCGEYPTASGFALWVGASILKRQYIPAVISVGSQTEIRNVLIYNPYFGSHHSFILMQTK